MKTLLFITVTLLASCSSDDPEPQVPCETLQVQLNEAQKAILDHQAKGSNYVIHLVCGGASTGARGHPAVLKETD